MNHNGRQTILDIAQRKQIAAVLVMGGTRLIAAQYVGCELGAIRRTAARHPDFHVELCRAEARHELAQLRVIRDAARDEKNWRAGIWILERRYPERYTRRKPKVVTAQQISLLLEQFAEIVAAEVPNDIIHDRLLVRLRRLTATLRMEP